MPTEVIVPPLGQTVDTVTLVQWYKRPGETVQQGEKLFAIETDKATLDIEALGSGVLQNVQAQEGDEVKVLSVIGVLEDLAPSPALVMEETKKVFISPRARRLAEQEGAPIEQISASGPQGAIIERDVQAYLAHKQPGTRPEPVAISPVARRMAEERGVDWHNLEGSGARGKVMKQDVEQAALTMGQAAFTADPLAGRDTRPAMAKAPASMETRPTAEARREVAFTGVRAVIAERMAASHAQTAPVTLTSEVDATALVELRATLARDGVQVTYNDLLLLILARALQEHPRLNASIEGGVIKEWPTINIGVAVDTERGLLAPVVQNLAGKGLREIAQLTAALFERARQGLCAPAELRGGTFTLTNLGMYNIDAFTPLINLPECAILGVGRIKTQPVYYEGNLLPRQVVWLSLTFDHRLVDGAPAARFLQRVSQLIEKPHLLIT